MRQIITVILLILPFLIKAENRDSIWIVNNYIKKEQYIMMRDGIRLFTSIYLPKDNKEKHPILITRTPYSCKPYGENNFRKFWSNHYKDYFYENYIMVVQDVRGKHMSEGTFVDVRPFNQHKKLNTDIDEASDAYDTIDWLVKNLSENNGKVGVFGVSYPGFYSTQAALSNHPALVAVSPQAPVTDWFVGDDLHHNGAFFIFDAFEFLVNGGFGVTRQQPNTEGFKRGFRMPSDDNYAFFLKTGALPNFTKLTGDSIHMWTDMMEHPDYDAWWQARNVRTSCYNINPAVLVVGGLFDAEDCFGSWNTYKAINSQSSGTICKLVMGPWSHGQWTKVDGTHLGNIQFGSNTTEWYAENMEIPFFNYYLKGKGSVDNIKEANIFFTGENEWRQFSQWPPANTIQKNLFLQSSGNLGWVGPTTKRASYSEYVSDPAKPVPYAEGIITWRTYEYLTYDQRFASSRPDVLVFQTEALTDDVILAGPVIADLQVSISSTDADFVVKLIDVFPDNFEYSKEDKYVMGGYEMIVRGDVLRGRYRNSLEKPEAFRPDHITEVKYSMPDVAHTFKKGHKIMIQIQSSWFPLVDRNPQKFIDVYHAMDSDFQKARIRIYHNKIHKSKITLSVLE